MQINANLLANWNSKMLAIISSLIMCWSKVGFSSLTYSSALNSLSTQDPMHVATAGSLLTKSNEVVYFYKRPIISSIRKNGQIQLNLNLGLHCDYKCNFIIADVKTSIIQNDFLAHNLLPDCCNHLLVDGIIGLSTTYTNCNFTQTNTKTSQIQTSCGEGW